MSGSKGKAEDPKNFKKPTGVSDAAWQKFQQLKEKRLAMSSKLNIREDNKFKAPKAETSSISGLSYSEANETRNTAEDQGKWLEIKNILGKFDHLEAACVDQHKDKSGLEKELEKAIAAGKVNEADKLSDQLANREFGSKIANAFDAQKFSKRQKEKEEDLNEKKKRKLNWQFEHKEKWEMKANM